ncbi:MAG: NfeD family protein [Bacteroidales bacterium]
MNIDVWQLWLAGAVIFMILEIFVPSFFCVCIGVGCMGAAIAAFCGGQTIAQLLLFSLLTIAAFFGVRPLIKRYFYKAGEAIRTNVDRLIDRTARVSERIDSSKNTGRVMLDGDCWKAVSQDGSIIEEGAIVKIVAIDSIVLTVNKQ